MTRGAVLVFGDEMRLGLIAVVRKRWTPRGHKLVVRLQRVYKWTYLALGVDVANAELHWSWIASMKKECIGEVLRAWKEAGVAAVSWDNASGHKCREHADIGVARVNQPPYSPEVNPPERVFEEVRRAVEGRNYDTVEDKAEEVEKFLRELNGDKERLRSLVQWKWITEALAGLVA